jgi:Mn2+/Fe2+ NRAMP family transporter
MRNPTPLLDDHALLRSVAHQPLHRRLAVYLKLSGPGWLQSAITLGGGSLSGSLYLGVLGGFGLLWLQPVAMIFGIIMLSGIGYVTMCTGKPALQAINEHVNPVLGYGWAIASLVASMVWAMPQYSLSLGVLQ